MGREFLSMKKVLFYVEPHPIRNYFSEFMDPGYFFYEIASHKNFSGIDWKIFSNSFVLNEISERAIKLEEERAVSTQDTSSDKDKNLSDKINDKLIYPEQEDEYKIRSFLREWGEEEILARNELVLGNGTLCDYYQSLLAKLFITYNFTHVVLWSENGAVKNFCEKAGISVIHMELGPTRLPFQETILIDPSGTNANSSLCQCDRPYFTESVDSALWTTDFSKNNNVTTKEFYLTPGGVIAAENRQGEQFLIAEDSTLQSIDEMHNITYIKNYVIVSLQLADDLNTLNHSKFSNPKNFLEFIVPKLLAMGYNVLIKRHPGSKVRIFNLTRELEAIDYAKNLADNVYILPGEMKQKEFVLLSKNAQAILSINSSVSFESWLMGTPGLVFGNAVFDTHEKLLTFSHDFISGGNLLKDERQIDSIKNDISYSLNNFFLPKNIFVLADALAKIVSFYDKNRHPNFVKWLYNHVDIFSLLLQEKLSDIDEKIGVKPGIDFYKEMENALPNEGKYQYRVDEFYVKNTELLLRGWLTSESARAEMIFIEYAGYIYCADKTARPDVKKHFPFAEVNSGFTIRNKVNELNDNIKEGRLYIYGSDKQCRFVEISLK